MSKGLKALKKIKWKLEDKGILGEEYELCDVIEKELKALKDIVKTFKIKVSINKFGQCFVESNDSIYAISRSTYDLLKEVLL